MKLIVLPKNISINTFLTDLSSIFNAAKAKIKISNTKLVMRPIIPRDEPANATTNALRPSIRSEDRYRANLLIPCFFLFLHNMPYIPPSNIDGI